MAGKKKAAANGGNNEVIEAIHALSKEKNISEEVLFSAIDEAIRLAYKKNFPKGAAGNAEASNIVASMDRQDGTIHVWAKMFVRDEITNPATQITLEEAQAIRPGAQLDDIVEKDVTPSGFLRVAAMAAKQKLIERIRKAESGSIYDKYADKGDEILTGIVKRVGEHAIILDLDHTEGILEESEMVPGEILTEGEHVKVYVVEVAGDSGASHLPQVHVSRRREGLVKRLFEMEVPEIVSGTVTIKAIARKAGVRTKMAVYSSDPLVDPVGACVGQRGARVERVVAELRGEKVDIIKWSEDPVEFVANALNPAHVITVFASTEHERECRVVVPDNQLSLAIGKEGLNSSLAHQLTKWKIDIKSESQAAAMDDMIDDADPMFQAGSMVMEHEDVFDLGADDSI